MTTETATDPAPDTRPLRQGVFFGLAAYLIWGFFPAYFKALAQVPPLEVLAHRIFWSAALLLILVFAMGRRQALAAAFADRATLRILTCSTLLIAANWLIFIYAVAAGQVLQSSLGYFITPLINVALGFVFLKERLRPLQNLSLLLAVAGVLILTLSYGQVPWIALALAGSFGTYGLLRKTANIDALLGLTVETCLLAPLALGYLLVVGAGGEGRFLGADLSLNLLLPLAGVVTSLPLLLFAGAARRLRLATIGFLQYITPSLHLLLAVAAFGEAFTLVHLVTFACIWSGLVLFSLDFFRSSRTAKTLRSRAARP
ncbi:EamA family transporter RarD [Desulfuromonas versatilis]|uniref:EamA family transporter RarD n=1 Tax=Desulfuromonas versatilis TaxID=2802975 RepID=UPI001CED542F|nr:EamA family transporter RarD [Desulfuromonas versatilis]